MHEKFGERTNVLNLRILTLVSPSSTSHLGTSMDREVSCPPLVTGTQLPLHPPDFLPV